MALRDINLIPPDILSRRYFLRHLFLWAGCLTLSLSLIGGIYLYQNHTVLAQKRSMTTLEDMHAHLGTRIEEINQLQEELKRLDQQQSILENITRNQAYSRVLLKLADIMNEGTWLSRLAIESNMDKDKEYDAQLNLTGFSFSNENLGNFINRLSAEALFKEVVLNYATEIWMSPSNYAVNAAVRLIKFQIECKI